MDRLLANSLRGLAILVCFAFLAANYASAGTKAGNTGDAVVVTSGEGDQFYLTPSAQDKGKKSKEKKDKKKKKDEEEEEKPAEEKKDDAPPSKGGRGGGGGGGGGTGLVGEEGGEKKAEPPKGPPAGFDPRRGPAGGGGGGGNRPGGPGGGMNGPGGGGPSGPGGADGAKRGPGGGPPGGPGGPGGPNRAGGGGGNADVTNHPIKWKKDLSEAIKDSATANKPVFAFFFSGINPQAQNLLSVTFQDKDLSKYINANYIPVLINMEEQQALVKQYGVKRSPEVVLITSDGKVADTISGMLDVPTYTAELKKRQSKVAEHKDAANADKAKKKCEEGDEALTNSKYTVALGLYKAAAQLEAKGKWGDKARVKIEDIEKIANDKLLLAKELIDARNYLEASKALPDVVALFSGTRAAVEAGQIARQLENDNLAKKSIRISKAKQSYTQYTMDLKSGRMGNALDRLRNISKTYKDVPDVFNLAAAELKRFEADEVKMRKVRDEAAAAQCKIWKDQAKTWAMNDRPRKAREFYQKIIDVFPGTTFAEEAELEMSLVSRN